MTKYIITKEFRGAKRYWSGALFSAFRDEACEFASKPAAEATQRALNLALSKVTRVKPDADAKAA